MPVYRSPYEVGPARLEACGEPAPRTAALALTTALGRLRMGRGGLGALGLELPDLTGALP
jgi:hypothetical protein